MRKIIAIANQKGGVGKTTTTMALGDALAQLGKRVLLIDDDPQGNLSDYLGFTEDGAPTITELLLAKAFGNTAEVIIRRHERNGLWFIPATIRLCTCETQLFSCMSRESVLRRVLEHEAFADFDYVLIDCQPSLGILTLNAFAAATSVLIPVQSQKFAVDGLTSLLGTLQQVQLTINPALRLEGIVQTMTDRTHMSQAVSKALRGDYGSLVFDACISRSVEAANSSYSQRSLTSYSNKLGKEYMALANELLRHEVIE